MSNSRSRFVHSILQKILFQNIIIGIGGGMVACISALSSKRQEILLYLAVSILAVNSVDIVLTEYWFYTADMPKILKSYSNHTLIDYGEYKKVCGIPDPSLTTVGS